MDQANGNKIEAAKLLGVSHVTLWKKLKQLDLKSPSSAKHLSFPNELLSNLVSELLITRRPDQAWLPRCHQYIECP